MKISTAVMALTTLVLVASMATGTAFAQTASALKESGKAVSEKALEGKETVQAAVSSEPNKSMHKVKAKTHKWKSEMHDRNAKVAGDQIGK
jgi:Ni/Co efflux regulator RcnB